MADQQIEMEPGSLRIEIPDEYVRARDTGDELIAAAQEIANTVKFGRHGNAEAADHIESLDTQPWPITVVLMSPTAVRLLRALADIEDVNALREALWRDRPVERPMPTYGPKRHKGE